MRTMFFFKIAFTLCLVIGFTQARAKIEKLTTTVSGLICPTCKFGLEKHIKKIEGVKRYTIDLATGEVAITFKKKVLATRDAVKKAIDNFKRAIKDAGFTSGKIIRVRAKNAQRG